MKGENRVFLEAIKKALESGWRECGYPENGWGVDSGQWMAGDSHLMINHFKRGDEYYHRSQILFSHKFAQALWGHEKHEAYGSEWYDEDWKWHLQQMVIADDPFVYLEANA